MAAPVSERRDSDAQAQADTDPGELQAFYLSGNLASVL